ncbi:hypothetical protein HOLleu_06356 [Holothuria leucospilota]|uniref:Uncharacterized protein n=1 Tax=Holothuria leucospilota TaxID=206669 RepID=A0A9Q1CKT2_HOLLE|nr:hypothetical protein HOLleu_06356 [Holothuria leucospilota]
MAIYRACFLSTFPHGSECWALYSKQEIKLNPFHMRNLRRILGIKWSDHVTNNKVLTQARLPSIFSLLREQRLRWLGHAHRIPDYRIPKVLLYGELASGKRTLGWPHLRYREVFKRDLQLADIDAVRWEEIAKIDEKFPQLWNSFS